MHTHIMTGLFLPSLRPAFPEQDRGAAVGSRGRRHPSMPLEPSPDGCGSSSLSAAYLDAVTAGEISNGDAQHLVDSPPTPSNQPPNQ